MMIKWDDVMLNKRKPTTTMYYNVVYVELAAVVSSIAKYIYGIIIHELQELIFTNFHQSCTGLQSRFMYRIVCSRYPHTKQVKNPAPRFQAVKVIKVARAKHYNNYMGHVIRYFDIPQYISSTINLVDFCQSRNAIVVFRYVMIIYFDMFLAHLNSELNHHVDFVKPQLISYRQDVIIFFEMPHIFRAHLNFEPSCWFLSVMECVWHSITEMAFHN